MSGLVWRSTHDDLTGMLATTPGTVADVVATLAGLQGVLESLTPKDDDNPVADFNRLYHTITAMILARLEHDGFEDPEFLTLLDVEFARRYFDALRLWSVASPETPQTWMVLFRRVDDDVRSLPAAAAGVNAHINYDLPFALLTTWEQLRSSPANERQYRDYLLVNEVFADAIPGLRRGYLERWQHYFDRLNGGLDDWYQNRLVEFTRGLAWQSGERLWLVRNDLSALRTARKSLDRNAALLGRALLSPFLSLLQ